MHQGRDEGLLGLTVKEEAVFLGSNYPAQSGFNNAGQNVKTNHQTQRSKNDRVQYYIVLHKQV
jgi:hypothetical protein